MTGEAREPTGNVGPLDGVTVLDASRVLAGPFCTMQLGDLGAEVIKVERPDGGDQTRGWHPPTFGDDGEAAYYLSVNRNKRSITLNLASEAGRDVFRDLAADADVVIENFRVGRMDRWGLGYEDLAAENPELVYCHVSGYGEWGPDKDRPAYDLVAQAEGGLMSITGIPGGEPVRVGVAITDMTAGMYASQAILAALLHRYRHGDGQKIDVSLLDGVVALTSYMATFYFATGEPPERSGSKIPNIVPYQAFETRDDWVVIGVPSENLWPDFCAAIGREDLADAYPTNADRVAARADLEPELEAEVASYRTDALLERLDEHGVPSTRINDMADVFEHPQVLARDMRQEIEHPDIDDLVVPGSPFNLSRTPATQRRYPPRLGEHTDEVLAEHGYDPADIERLRERGAI